MARSFLYGNSGFSLKVSQKVTTNTLGFKKGFSVEKPFPYYVLTNGI